MKKKSRKIRRYVFGTRKELSEKANHLITLLIRVFLLIAGSGALIQLRWSLLFIISLTFFITFLPKIIEKRYKIDIPVELEILSILFIFASLFLGEVQNFYTKVWWWDILLHGLSGVTLGFIGFLILYVLDKGGRIDTSPFLIALFSFCFAVAIGCVWEIFEFSMDQIFGLNMQKSGLLDTMWDLIVDSLGALIASFTGYWYMKKREVFIFDSLISRFERDNPALFKEIKKLRKKLKTEDGRKK